MLGRFARYASVELAPVLYVLSSSGWALRVGRFNQLAEAREKIWDSVNVLRTYGPRRFGRLRFASHLGASVLFVWLFSILSVLWSVVQHQNSVQWTGPADCRGGFQLL